MTIIKPIKYTEENCSPEEYQAIIERTYILKEEALPIIYYDEMPNASLYSIDLYKGV